jgi:predicted phosphodiesterase
MKQTKNTKIDLVKSYVEKYIELGIKNHCGYSKKFIAKVIAAEHPDLFKDFEAVRTYIRVITQSKGKGEFYEKYSDIASRFALISNGYNEEITGEPFIIPKQYKKPLIIADLHSIFWEKWAVMAAIEDGVKHGCDSVIINGDFMDFYQYSKFSKDPLTIDKVMDEKEWGVDVLQILQDTFGKVFLKMGNHDIRREKFIKDRFFELDFATYSDYLMFDRSTVDIIHDWQHIHFGKLNIIHGHEYYGGGVHIAYNRLNKTFDNVLSAHSHVSQSVFRQNINGKAYGSWTIGCLCHLHPRYNPMNNWNLGFARAERDASGEFEVINRRFIDKKHYPA